MSTYSIDFKIAASKDSVSRLEQSLSPTICDGYESPSYENSPMASELRLSSMKDILPLLDKTDDIIAERIVLDLRGFAGDFPRLVIFLAPLFYRWKGRELIAIADDGGATDWMPPALADLLRSLELRSKGVRIVSCPTCARCRTNFPAMVRSLEDRLGRINKPLDVAIMGCEVNGPGEAKAADVGIAFGDQKGMLFKNGEKVRVVEIEEAAEALMQAIEEM
ncbi:MAG: flavodoxin-dependent (E)-4-hydroxy-3-methylbut-2-enyl-diphosphate synthase [Candidatus Omnitrophota bacterium]